MGTWLHQLWCDCVLQQECYKVMHSLLVHTDTREATMNYLTQVLLRNSKRAQIQASLFCPHGCSLFVSLLHASLLLDIFPHEAKVYLCVFNV